jgi:hypothetical protein
MMTDLIWSRVASPYLACRAVSCHAAQTTPAVRCQTAPRRIGPRPNRAGSGRTAPRLAPPNPTPPRLPCLAAPRHTLRCRTAPLPRRTVPAVPCQAPPQLVRPGLTKSCEAVPRLAAPNRIRRVGPRRARPRLTLPRHATPRPTAPTLATPDLAPTAPRLPSPCLPHLASPRRTRPDLARPDHAVSSRA